MHEHHVLTIAITKIGFEEATYTVNEEDGVLEVCVRVFEPDGEMPLVTEISVIIETRVGTAGMVFSLNCLYAHDIP